jgi:hypothetical protein
LRVGQRQVLGARIPLQRQLVVRARAFIGNAGPQVFHVRRRQLLAQRAFQRLRQRLGILARIAQGGEHDDFARRPVVQAFGQPRQKTLGMARRLGERALVGRIALRQVAERSLRRRDLAIFEQHAHPLPDGGGRDPLALDHRLDEARAALRQLLRLVPDRIDGGKRRVVAAGKARQARVAADLEVLARVERGFALERRPVAPLAEQAQPIAAQHLADIGAAVLPQEPLHVFRLGVFQPHGDAPIVRPRLEDVLVQVLGVAREAHGIAGAVGVVGAEQGLVGRALAGRRRDRGARQQQAD